MLRLYGLFAYDGAMVQLRSSKMLSQAVISVLLIAGCLLLYGVGTRERTVKHSKTLR